MITGGRYIDMAATYAHWLPLVWLVAHLYLGISLAPRWRKARAARRAARLAVKR